MLFEQPDGCVDGFIRTNRDNVFRAKIAKLHGKTLRPDDQAAPRNAHPCTEQFPGRSERDRASVIDPGGSAAAILFQQHQQPVSPAHLGCSP